MAFPLTAGEASWAILQFNDVLGHCLGVAGFDAAPDTSLHRLRVSSPQQPKPLLRLDATIALSAASNLLWVRNPGIGLPYNMCRLWTQIF